MTNPEATVTENAAAIAEQAAAVAPETASSKKGASQKKNAPKGQKAAKDNKAKPAAKKESKAGKKATKPARTKDIGTPRAEGKGRENPGLDWTGQGREPGGDYESNVLAGPQRARVPLDRCQVF